MTFMEYYTHSSNVTEFIKYNRNEDKWDTTSNDISPLNTSNFMWVYVINNKILAQFYWGQTYVYNSVDRQWEEAKPYLSLPTNPKLYNNCVIENDLYFIQDRKLHLFNAESLQTSTKKVLDENYTIMTPYQNGTILFLNCIQRNEYRQYNLCLYNVTDNDYQVFKFNNENSGGSLNNNVPITTDKLVYIKDKLFIGPTNGSFYELNLK